MITWSDGVIYNTHQFTAGTGLLFKTRCGEFLQVFRNDPKRRSVNIQSMSWNGEKKIKDGHPDSRVDADSWLMNPQVPTDPWWAPSGNQRTPAARRIAHGEARATNGAIRRKFRGFRRHRGVEGAMGLWSPKRCRKGQEKNGKETILVPPAKLG